MSATLFSASIYLRGGAVLSICDIKEHKKQKMKDCFDDAVEYGNPYIYRDEELVFSYCDVSAIKFTSQEGAPCDATS